jgi:hypothetical protein
MEVKPNTLGKFLFFVGILLLPFSGLSQNRQEESDGWPEAISRKFYTAINPAKDLECCCCDIAIRKKIYVFEYEFDIPSAIYERDSFLLKSYAMEVIDSVSVAYESQKLIKDFRKRYSARKIKKFKKSCYRADIINVIQEDLYDNFVFISGKARIIYTFQE